LVGAGVGVLEGEAADSAHLAVYLLLAQFQDDRCQDLLLPWHWGLSIGGGACLLAVPADPALLWVWLLLVRVQAGMYEYDLTEEHLAPELWEASQFVPRCLRVRNHFCHRHLSEEEFPLELGAASQFVPRCLRVRNHFCHRHLSEEEFPLELWEASQFAPHHLREVKSLALYLVLAECRLDRPWVGW